MKKNVDWNKVEAGMLVEVPRVEFAPRYGWNGWLFSDAVVTGKRISKKTGRKIIDVDMCVRGVHNEYDVCRKAFYADEVFETRDAERIKALFKNWGWEKKADYMESLKEEDSNDGDTLFLVDRGFIYDEDGNLMPSTMQVG